MDFVIASDYEALSRIAARLIVADIATRPDATIIVAVGNTPVGPYRELAHLYQQGAFASDRLRPFQLDEYLGIATTDRRSLFGWAKRDFLDPLHIPETRVVRLASDTNDAEATCRAYDQAIQQIGGVVDIAILGLGPNGHLGFNEPPAAGNAPTRVVSLTEETIRSNMTYWGERDQVPTQAMTCGMSHLLHARHTILLVSGAHKRAILERTLSGPITPEVPSSYLRLADHVTVIADRAAWPLPLPEGSDQTQI